MASSRGSAGTPERTTTSTPSVTSELCETTAVVVPPDGGWGWVIVAASFLCNFMIEGINSSFSTYMKDLTVAFDASESSVSLIGSLLVGVDQLSGPFASGISNRYGFRVALISGGVVGFVGQALSYFSNSVVFLYFSFGVLGGIGNGLVYMPAAIAVNFFFSRWRAVAVSFAMIGLNFGSATMPHVINYCNNTIGWRNSLLVQGGLMLTCSALGVLFRAPPATQVTPDIATQGSATAMSITSASLQRDRGNNRNYPSVLEVVGEINSRYVLSTLSRRQSQVWEGQSWMPDRGLGREVAKETGCCASCLRAVFCCACCRRRAAARGVRPIYRDDIFFEGSTVRLTQTLAGDPSYHMKVTRMTTQRDLFEEMSKRCVMFPHALRRTLATMCDLSLLRSLPMVIMTLSFMFSSAAYYVPFTYLRLRELDKGGDDVRATMFLTVISLSAMAARLLCAALTSLPCVNHFYVISTTQTVGACAVLVCALDPPYNAQIACCVCYGFALACASNLRSLIIVDLVGLNNLTNAFGIILLFQGVGFIAGPPLAGLIRETCGSFPSVFWFAGGLILTSAVLTYPLNELRKRQPAGDLVRA